jgi:hypothetical protein
MRLLTHLAVLLLLALPSFSFACTALTITTTAHHFKSETDYNEQNFGLGCERMFTSDWYGKAGFYRNSYDRNTLFLGTSYVPFHYADWKAGGSAALVTGYTPDRVEVVGMLTAMYERKQWGVNLHYVPTVVFTFELKYIFK